MRLAHETLRFAPEEYQIAMASFRDLPRTCDPTTVLIRRCTRVQMISLHALSSVCNRLHAELGTRKRIENTLIRSLTALFPCHFARFVTRLHMHICVCCAVSVNIAAYPDLRTSRSAENGMGNARALC
jgi:hypothetical protein